MADYLSYNGSNNNGGGSSKFLILMGAMMLFFIAMPFFMPSQPQDKKDDEKTPQTQEKSIENLAVTVKYPVESRVLESDQFQITWSNIGGGRAKDIFIKDPDRYFEHGDFIRSQKPANDQTAGILPFQMTLPSFGVSAETQFQTTSPDTVHNEVKFTYVDPAGRYQFDKTFSTTDVPYVVHTKVALTNRTDQPVNDSLSISFFIKQIEGEEPGLFTPGAYVAAKCYADGDMEYVDATDKDETETYSKSVKWFGVDESYFAMAMMMTYAGTCEIKNTDGLLSSTYSIPLTLNPNATTSYEFDVYVGPKEARYLEAAGEASNLPSVIDYGWMEVLAKPMAWILDKFHELTGNWGLAIILLTIIVRLLLWPIAQKSQLSMMRMSKIAPLMQKLQEQYKDDPQTLQQKQLELYQQHQINPFGCLPLLLQMPIFFALYRCIFVTGGLYKADFVLWIHDLSARDPYFVLPVLCVGLLVLQQVLTPSVAKNTQQKVMMIAMPVFFGLMMLFLPAGLNLYMLVSSMFSMGQSFYVRRLIAREDAKAAADGPNPDVIDVDSLSSKDKRAAKRRDK